MSDITFKFNTHGIRGGVEITPDQLRRFPAAAKEEMIKQFKVIGDKLLFELKFLFFKMIHERPRNPAYKNGNSEPLLSRMQAAFKTQIVDENGNLTVNIFDIAHMDMATRNEGFNTASEGWFLRFSDGHDGRRHGGVGWGFVPHDLAVALAKEAADLYITDPAKKAAWIMEMDEVFKGRHGEGIMSRLDVPMFKMFPKFGDVGKFVEQHPGYFSWPAIGMVGQDMVKKNGEVSKLIQDAFDIALSKI